LSEVSVLDNNEGIHRGWFAGVVRAKGILKMAATVKQESGQRPYEKPTLVKSGILTSSTAGAKTPVSE